MKRIFCPVTLVCALALLGCSTAYHTYRWDIDAGKRMLDAGDYSQAREDFIGAAKAEPAESASYALAATASYKMNDLEGAQGFIDEAQKLDGKSDFYPRILAYKTLVLLKEGRREEGLEALHAYHDRYKSYYPMKNYEQVEKVLRTGKVDLTRLERLLDGDVRQYESDMAQWYGEGTGYFAQRYGRPFVNMVPSR